MSEVAELVFVEGEILEFGLLLEEIMSRLSQSGIGNMTEWTTALEFTQRSHLYRAMERVRKGTARLSTLQRLAESVGYKIALVPIEKKI